MENGKKLPPTLLRRMKPYLHSHEKVEDFLKEVWVVRYDVSWIIITNERVIVATKKSFELKFVDYGLKSLDIDFSMGIPFDTIEVEAIGKKYMGHFYWFNRKKTLAFLEKIEKKLEPNAEGGNMKNEEEECEPLETLKELAELKKQGIITEEEFKEKKKKLLDEV